MRPTPDSRRRQRSATGAIRRAATTLAAALALAALSASAVAAEPRLTVADGSVEIGHGEPIAWAAAHAGDAVRAGDSVRTGRGARAEVALGTGVVRLYENSLLRIPSDAMRPEGPAAVGLERGSSIFEVLKRRPSDPFEVRTPEVVASVKGTRFSVVLEDQAAAISVYTGLVGVRGVAAATATEVLVREGFAAVGGAGRPFDLVIRPGSDPWSGWKTGETPPSPRALPASPAAENDVDAARRAALRAAGPEVVAQVVERHPELAKGASDTARKTKQDRHQAPASLAMDVGPEPGRAAVDPVTVATTTRGTDPRSRGVQEQAAEVILNGTSPGGTSAGLPGGAATGGISLPALGLVATVKPEGDGQKVVLRDTSGSQVAGLKDTRLLEIISGQRPPSDLGSNLLGVLTANNVDPMAFAKFLYGSLPR